MSTTEFHVPSYSIVIPTLNEEKALERQVESLPAVIAAHDAEVIVVDGGSTDGTGEIASRLGRVMAAPRGRSRQMNAGAAQASGDVLVFLHADTLLPPEALSILDRVMSHGVVGGSFRKRPFDHPPLLRLADWITGIRMDVHLTLYGDRAVFVRKDAFHAIGGFRDDMVILEDVDLGRRLRRIGRLVQAPGAVETSPRRFLQGGVVRTLLLMLALELSYRLGWNWQTLARQYRPYR